jgi:hypothetical protein
MKPKALLVTTIHKGVFFGYGAKTAEKTIELTQARLCVHWSADVKGITGLAANGPSQGCRIGPAAPSIIIQDVTSVMTVSDKAVEKWEAGPWS